MWQRKKSRPPFRTAGFGSVQGKPSAGSRLLQGSLVSLPTGVLASASARGQDNIAWEPQPGPRLATVTLKVGHQFVSAGQSLKPSEDRDGTVQLLVGFGWYLDARPLPGLARFLPTLQQTKALCCLSGYG
jgi:hypothetical protein